MEAQPDFLDINRAKLDMDHIYNRDDPRLYCATLRKLGYRIPDYAREVCQLLVEDLRRQRRQDEVRIIDLGCSYGINAALLKYGLSMQDLYQHWDQDRLDGESPQRIIAADQQYFDSLGKIENLQIIGIDQAENAVNFAREAGLLDQGLAIDLESQSLPAPAADELAAADLLISTGCVGYVTEKSFGRMMPALSQKPSAWIANFVLRMFPYQPIEDCLAEWGYVTEKFDNATFVQRRFASADEQQKTFAKLAGQNIAPSAEEKDGQLVAEFFLSRPAEEVARRPLPQLLAALLESNEA